MTIKLQLRNGKIRKITAVGLAWVWGRLVEATVMYCKGTAGTDVTIDTISQRLESDPNPATATNPSTQPTKSFVVGAEVVDASHVTDATSGAQKFEQLNPFFRHASTASLATSIDVGLSYLVPGELKEILDIRVTDYIRFTETTPGTALPVGGVEFLRDDVIGMFTDDPTSAEL